jgi:hypothetical protein
MFSCHSADCVCVCLSLTCGQQYACVICVKINSENLSRRRFFTAMRSCNRFVGTVTRARDRRPRNRGSIYCRVKIFTFSPKRPDRSWATFSILFVGLLGLFYQGKRIAAWSWPPTLDPFNVVIETLTYVWQFPYALRCAGGKFDVTITMWLQNLNWRRTSNRLPEVLC